MNLVWLIISLIILLFLLLFYKIIYDRYKKISLKQHEALPNNQILSTPKPKIKSFWEMSDGEQVQYITDAYFRGDPVTSEKKVDPKVAADKTFVESLPKSNVGCEDKYLDCPKWAADQECEINPEYMLYNCAKSCKACSYDDQQKSELIRIYNSKEPAHCIYHGANYPGPFPYLYQLYNYGNPILGESLKFVEANPGDNA